MISYLLYLRVSAFEFDCALHSLNACNVLLDRFNSHRVVELIDGLLEMQVEELILELCQLL